MTKLETILYQSRCIALTQRTGKPHYGIGRMGDVQVLIPFHTEPYVWDRRKLVQVTRIEASWWPRG